MRMDRQQTIVLGAVGLSINATEEASRVATVVGLSWKPMAGGAAISSEPPSRPATHGRCAMGRSFTPWPLTSAWKRCFARRSRLHIRRLSLKPGLAQEMS